MSVKHQAEIFKVKEIVWAYVRGYPWWPGYIEEVIGKKETSFNVGFIGEDSHAIINVKNLKKYEENYEEMTNSIKLPKLIKAIEIADQIYCGSLKYEDFKVEILNKINNKSNNPKKITNDIQSYSEQSNLNSTDMQLENPYVDKTERISARTKRELIKTEDKKEVIILTSKKRKREETSAMIPINSRNSRKKIQLGKLSLSDVDNLSPSFTGGLTDIKLEICPQDSEKKPASNIGDLDLQDLEETNFPHSGSTNIFNKCLLNKSLIEITEEKDRNDNRQLNSNSDENDKKEQTQINLISELDTTLEKAITFVKNNKLDAELSNKNLKIFETSYRSNLEENLKLQLEIRKNENNQNTRLIESLIDNYRLLKMNNNQSEFLMKKSIEIIKPYTDRTIIKEKEKNIILGKISELEKLFVEEDLEEGIYENTRLEKYFNLFNFMKETLSEDFNSNLSQEFSSIKNFYDHVIKGPYLADNNIKLQKIMSLNDKGKKRSNVRNLMEGILNETVN